MEGFQGAPRLLDNGVALKSFLLFLAFALLLSFILNQAGRDMADFFKSSLSVTTTSRHSFNVHQSRLKSFFLAIATIVLSLFISLFVNQIIDGDMTSMSDLDSWKFTTLRQISAKALIVSIISLTIYIVAKSISILLYSSIHFNRDSRGVNSSSFLSYLIIDALLIIPLLFVNEIIPLSGNILFWIALGIWLLTKVWSAVHSYMFFSSNGVSIIQFFLYFCGLEILPLAVFFKCVFQVSQMIEP